MSNETTRCTISESYDGYTIWLENSKIGQKLVICGRVATKDQAEALRRASLEAFETGISRSLHQFNRAVIGETLKPAAPPESRTAIRVTNDHNGLKIEALDSMDGYSQLLHTQNIFEDQTAEQAMHRAYYLGYKIGTDAAKKAASEMQDCKELIPDFALFEPSTREA